MKYFKKTMHQGAQPSVFRNAKHLRNHPTRAEEILWERLKNNQIEGVHFRRQHPFSNYVPDFYAHSLKLVIELDGSIHEDKSVQYTDEERELSLRLRALHILRYTNEYIYNFEDEVVADIRQTVIDLKKKKG